VFVDDFRVNVDGAEAVGMTGILHRDTEATLTELGRLFGFAL
jgi:FMN phosphatase YigB (HAD superfamily)